MAHTRIIGYIIVIGLILMAILMDGLVLLFVNLPSFMIVLGGTFAIALISGGIFTRRRSLESNQCLWQNITSGFVLTSLLGTSSGVIGMLFKMNDPSQIGSSMAFAILSCFTGLLGLGLISLPMEDHYNKKLTNYTELSMSRIAWFGFPILSFLFVLSSFLIMLTAVAKHLAE